MPEPMTDERLTEIRAHVAAAYDNYELGLVDELLAEVEQLRTDLAGHGTHGAIEYERNERIRIRHRWIEATRALSIARDLLAEKKAEVERLRAELPDADVEWEREEMTETGQPNGLGKIEPSDYREWYTPERVTHDRRVITFTGHWEPISKEGPRG